MASNSHSRDVATFVYFRKKMSSEDQVQAVEILTRVASVTMGLKEQMDIIRIINPQATVLPTDTEFEIGKMRSSVFIDLFSFFVFPFQTM